MHGGLAVTAEMVRWSLPLTYTARRGFASISPLAPLRNAANGAVWGSRHECARQ
jgi:hypothetical protein